MPVLATLLQRRHALPNPISTQGFGNSPEDFTSVLINGFVSGILVLLGGLFAGLTLALMGQDEINLCVLSTSGRGRQKSDAQKVLHLLSKGKHWVLVTLLLANVIVNESLPIVLDGEKGGGWTAVFMSTGLVVVFGEIIPQSVCAKYGLAIGASSANLVLCLMYALSPIGYPIARLLDHLLGSYQDHTFSREGLKTLILLHEVPRPLLNAPERLHAIEAASICSLLSASTVPIADIMTPFKGVFVLPSDAPLNEITRFDILRSGFSKIPVCEPGGSERCYGVLDVRCLVGVGGGFEEQQVTIGDLPLEGLMHLSPETSVADAMEIFRNRGAKMVLVSEGGRREGKALGILTFRDVMEGALGGGGEMGMR